MGGGTSSTQAASTEAAGTEATSTEAASSGGGAYTITVGDQTYTTDVDPSSITIACSVYQQDAHQSLIRQGAKDAAADYGVNILDTVTDSDVSKELEFLNNCSSQGVDGYVWAPCGSSTMPALKDVKDAGAYVSIVNGHTPSADDPFDYIGYFDGGFYNNQESMAAKLGEVVYSELQDVFADNIASGEPIKVGIIAFDNLSKETSDLRANATLAQLDALGIPYEVVGRQDAVEQDVAIQVATDMLTANPDLDLFASCCESASIGAIMTIANMNLTGSCYVAGIDVSVQIAKLMQDYPGIGLTFVGQSSYDGGYIAAEHIIQLCLGINPEENAALNGKENNLDDMVLTRSDPDGIQKYIDDMAAAGVTG